MSQTLTLEDVRAQVAELLYEEPAELTDEENLIDWDLDWVRIMSLVEKWRRLGAQITFADSPSARPWRSGGRSSTPRVPLTCSTTQSCQGIWGDRW
ncbi:hypothetical protein [Saccharopolyspora sp. ASAGF58]|uniref:hypothetical protein n=1 Tax=Saccharopolyspora sp. ASAGF58 TaxID=2719023 RepID=UPI001FF0D02A|nr:hypothetical protein [Saccharopolyspora sp. ASAGF58]